jgi:polysaccharide export outer membrane protein
MKDFEPSENEEYTLGPGDEVTVDVPGRPELTGAHTIGPDGRISMPVAGVVAIGGLTRDQAGAALTQSLSAYYASISATVAVQKYAGNRVLVLGNVEHPGIVLFDGTPTLLEALSRAGLSTQRDKPMGMPERVSIYRGDNQVITVDLRMLLDKGDSFADLRLRRNDRIYVPSDADRIVSVMGAVQHPGSVHLLSTTTLPQVLAEAGGITEHAGQSPKIQIIDPSTGKTRIVEYKELMTPTGALEISLKPGEIIFVPDSKFYKATYVLERLNPAVSIATMALIYK